MVLTNNVPSVKGKPRAAVRDKLWGAYARLRPHLNWVNLCALAIGLLALNCVPQIGVTINDELRMRMQRAAGMEYFLDARVEEHFGRGMPLRAMALVYQTLGSLTQNDTVNGIIRVFILLAGMVALYAFLEKLTKDMRFAALVPTAILVFLPLSFEHTPPNAFIAQACSPLVTLLLSFFCFLNYLDKKSRKSLVFCGIWFGLTLLTYEFMLVYLLVFPLLCLKYHTPGQKNVLGDTLRKCMVPLALVVLYITATVATRMLVPTTYEGATFGAFSLRSLVFIPLFLFTSAFPGYYFFNDRYRYFASIYANRYSLFDLAIFGLLFVLVGVFIWLLVRRGKSAGSKKVLGVLALCCLPFAFLPSLPYALNQHYQQSVGPNQFITLPVTYYLYIAIMTAVVALLWLLVARRPRQVVALVLAAFFLFAVPIQLANVKYTNVSKENFERLRTMEALFDTSIVQGLHGSIAAPSLFGQYNTLAFNMEYWTEYATQVKGLDCEVYKTMDFDSFDHAIYFLYDSYFIVDTGTEQYALVPQKTAAGREATFFDGALPDTITCEDATPVADGIFYRYEVSGVPVYDTA